ncbi:Elongation of very long chain fatty acids protein 6 [Branchiostoma belcheri]|nr:Elongation of very long chain fatty acids protein 6 [Branchiostoma belcheri]
MADNGSDIIAYPFEYQLPFEKDFNEKAALQWMGENWTAAFSYAILYVVLVFGGRYFMQNREKFDLRLPLTVWSSALAVFSTLGALRSAYDLWFILKVRGFQFSVCDSRFYHEPVLDFWAFYFTYSKLPELGDTAFIVLRKQKLIFLHWYHHITVLLYAWYSYKDTLAAGRWFYCMNFTVHALMYTYYAIRAAGYRVPRSYAMVITIAQTTQMVMGCVVNYTTYAALESGDACDSTYDNIVWSSIMYFSYFLLFAHFFYDAYMRKPPAKPPVQAHQNGLKHLTGKENGIHAGKQEHGAWKTNGIKRD